MVAIRLTQVSNFTFWRLEGSNHQQISKEVLQRQTTSIVSRDKVNKVLVFGQLTKGDGKFNET